MKDPTRWLFFLSLVVAACGGASGTTTPDLGAVPDLRSQAAADAAAGPDLATVVDLLPMATNDLASADDLTSVDGVLPVITIPDPGTLSLNGFWSIPNGGDMGSAGSQPELAYAVGVISKSPGYIGTDAVPGSQISAYFVFKTSPTFTNPFSITWDTDGTVDFAHIHDGAGLLFGAEIPPQTVGPNSESWVLQTDHVYVLEVHVTGATFF